jgi:hypothetical protein
VKREAINHTKMKRLCRRLDIPLYQAVGLLESIWHLTGREAPRGDLGKLSDEDIALAIDYRGDETALINALVASGWLDWNQTERLVVHDWSEHADDAVHMRLARARLFFVDGKAPKLTKLPVKEKESAQKFYDERAHKPAIRAHGVRTPDRLPEPVPEPEPLPVIEKPLCASDDARVGSLPPIDEPPFGTDLEPFPSEVGKENHNPGRRQKSPGAMTTEQETWWSEFWLEYWLKRGKKEARAAFRRLVTSETIFRKVMAGVRAQKLEMLERPRGKQPYPATWLNGERWDDELRPQTKVPTASDVGYRPMDEWKRGIERDSDR